jgi:hypothetical protein
MKAYTCSEPFCFLVNAEEKEHYGRVVGMETSIG